MFNIGFELKTISSSAQFMATNDCTCQGYNLMYECNVIGGVATVWKGTIFDCSSSGNEVVIFHSINSTSQRPQVCNNGAITGHIIREENGIYTSQLMVQVGTESNRSTIICAQDTGVNTPVIGSTLLTITTGSYKQQTWELTLWCMQTIIYYNYTVRKKVLL